MDKRYLLAAKNAPIWANVPKIGLQSYVFRCEKLSFRDKHAQELWFVQ